MSYTTEADKRRDSAKEHIQQAISDLSAIVVEQCEGYGEWNADYTEHLYEVFTTLLQLRDKL